MAKNSHYPSFQVMKEKNEWDDHTQKIIGNRLHPSNQWSFLTDSEVVLLLPICSLLTGDDRKDLLSYILSHIDQTLGSPIGEGQRKSSVPQGKILIRLGLKSLAQVTKERYSCSFTKLAKKDQHTLLDQCSQGQLPIEGNLVSQVDFFKKLLTLTLEAYYSHPQVWSEIGYAGPAYPRGYVRTQLGQLDPWEAQPEHE